MNIISCVITKNDLQIEKYFRGCDLNILKQVLFSLKYLSLSNNLKVVKYNDKVIHVRNLTI